MKQNFFKWFFGIIGLIFMAGCVSSTTGTKVDTVTGEGAEQNLFEQYKGNRPDTTCVAIGDSASDEIFKSIAGIYGTTIELTDKHISKVEHSKVGLTLEEVRKTKGEESYKQCLESLSPEDKKEYETFLDNSVNELSVCEDYLLDSAKLAMAVTNVNPKKFVTTPWQLPAALKAVKQAKNQIQYTQKSLKWLNETHRIYMAAQSYMGR